MEKVKKPWIYSDAAKYLIKLDGNSHVIKVLEVELPNDRKF